MFAFFVLMLLLAVITENSIKTISDSTIVSREFSKEGLAENEELTKDILEDLQ